jgi:quinol monooxygenase YgiN
MEWPFFYMSFAVNGFTQINNYLLYSWRQKVYNQKFITMKVKLFFVVLVIALITGSCGNKKSSEAVSVTGTSIAEPAVDSKMMIIARLTIKPEKAKDFIEAAKDIIAKSNAEEGCTYYQLFQDPYDNSKFVFVEEYKNQAAVDAHFAADYFNAFGPKISDMLIGSPEIKVVTVAKEVVQ